MSNIGEYYRRDLESLPAESIEAYCVKEIAKSLRLKDEYGFNETEKGERRIFALRDALVSVLGMNVETRNIWHEALRKVEARISTPE